MPSFCKVCGDIMKGPKCKCGAAGLSQAGNGLIFYFEIFFFCFSIPFLSFFLCSQHLWGRWPWWGALQVHWCVRVHWPHAGAWWRAPEDGGHSPGMGWQDLLQVQQDLLWGKLGPSLDGVCKMKSFEEIIDWCFYLFLFLRLFFIIIIFYKRAPLRVQREPLRLESPCASPALTSHMARESKLKMSFLFMIALFISLKKNRCGNCHQPVYGFDNQKWVKHEGKVFHDVCYNQERRCHVCRKPILGGVTNLLRNRKL